MRLTARAASDLEVAKLENEAADGAGRGACCCGPEAERDVIRMQQRGGGRACSTARSRRSATGMNFARYTLLRAASAPRIAIDPERRPDRTGWAALFLPVPARRERRWRNEKHPRTFVVLASSLVRLAVVRLAVGLLPVLRGARPDGRHHGQDRRAAAARADPGAAGPEGHPGGRARRGPALPEPVALRPRDPAGDRDPARQGRRRDRPRSATDLPQGEFLAERRAEGHLAAACWARASTGSIPYGYQIDIVDAISIPIGYAGVVTSLSGEQAPPGEFAEAEPEGRAQGHPPAGPLLREPEGVQGGRAGDRREPGLAAGQDAAAR